MVPMPQDAKARSRVRAWSLKKGAHLHDEGEVIAYSTEPMILIERNDGTTFWWTQSLVERFPFQPTE